MQPTVPSTFQEALRSIQDREFLTTKRWREQQWRAIRSGAAEEILLFERLLIRRMRNIGVPMFATEVMRSAERQRILHQAGRSKITSGPHMVGCAVDIVHGIKAWEIGEKAWSLVGHVGKEIIAQEGLNLRWGGDWKFYDPAHWEVTNWREYVAPF